MNEQQLEYFGFSKNKRFKDPYKWSKIIGNGPLFFHYDGNRRKIDLECQIDSTEEPITLIYDLKIKDMKQINNIFNKVSNKY